MNRYLVYSILTASAAFRAVQADDCACGFSNGNAIFLDSLETDFTRVKEAATIEDDWQVQDWRGQKLDKPFVRVAQYRNVVFGDKQGLQLLVRPPSGEDVGTAEIRTSRSDMKYGVYMVGMKTTQEEGTCSAFFWYHSNAREIDVELLSRENKSPGPTANLVIHSPASEAAQFDASKTPGFTKARLGFDPTSEFYEYRFDWTPDKVSFYFNNKDTKTLRENIPTEGGRVFLNHWSNGDPGWSAGPPTKDAAMWVKYFRAYFNSSDPARMKALEDRCYAARIINEGKVCKIGSDIAPIGPPAALPPGDSIPPSGPVGGNGLPSPQSSNKPSGSRSSTSSSNGNSSQAGKKSAAYSTKDFDFGIQFVVFSLIVTAAIQLLL